MATASTASSGSARYRNPGGGRELAQDTEIFSLDEEGTTDELKTAGTGTSEKSRLFDCPLDSDEEEDKPTPKKVVHKAQPTVKSRLDAFEGDGDSLSDELDLLPPLPGAANANTSWLNRYVPPEDNGLFRLHALNCCNPRIPNKCLIM